MNRNVIVTCAVTGGHMNFHKHPNFPITPKQIADACIEARQAGAAIAHIHVRDPNTGERSADPAHFREVVQRIRDSGSDILINLTTGEGGRYIPSDTDPRIGGEGTTLSSPEVRVRHVLELRPDICTLDMGTMNFGEHVFMNTPGHLRKMATLIKDAGVKPELEVFEAGHIRLANEFIKEGLVESPALFQLCLGIAYGAPAPPKMVQAMHDMLPENSNWAAFGISRWEFPIVAEVVNSGGHVRVGLEDNLYLGKGEFGTNGQLVEKAVRIIHDLGANTLTPNETRDRLKLKKRT